MPEITEEIHYGRWCIAQYERGFLVAGKPMSHKQMAAITAWQKAFARITALRAGCCGRLDETSPTLCICWEADIICPLRQAAKRLEFKMFGKSTE